ncbi:MAG TPA: hypothetical protein VJN18_03190 [Polyangiaceae bacterium]|nr:hypothetical protein [Polyangiaceae bacterium]
MKNISTNWARCAIGLCFVVPVGCGAAPEEASAPQDEPAESQQPLLGTASTSSCTSAQATFINKAIDAGRYVAVSGAFVSCLAQAIGITNACSGQATIDIDGASHLIDAYRNAGATWQDTIFIQDGLPDGPHILTLTVLGTKQAASCGPWIYVDRFDILP